MDVVEGNDVKIPVRLGVLLMAAASMLAGCGTGSTAVPSQGGPHAVVQTMSGGAAPARQVAEACFEKLHLVSSSRTFATWQLAVASAARMMSPHRTKESFSPIGATADGDFFMGSGAHGQPDIVSLYRVSGQWRIRATGHC